MTAGALNSDHVNYLILRYLQEAGLENAATAFYRDWSRPAEFRDPENLPFARNVRRHELVSVIQEGVLHDELVARVKKNERRFQWTGLAAREAQRDGRVQNGDGAARSRPASREKRKSRLQAMRAPDEFPTPAPKRQRRSEGSEGVHLNGDAMDVDAASPSAEADEDGDAASPAVQSEPEIIEVPERYDSMDVAVQTELKVGPKTCTMYWKVDKPGATILHSTWNPKDRTLLVVGDSLSRIFRVPEDIENVKQASHIDDPWLPAFSVVTASTWHPNGRVATYAVDSVRPMRCPMGDEFGVSQQMVVSTECDVGSLISYSCPPLLQPPGIVLALRYNHTGDRLMVLRTNAEESLAIVYHTVSPHKHCIEPVAWKAFDCLILDGDWTTSDSFAVCGEQGFSANYSVQYSDSSNTPNLDDNVEIFGLRETLHQARSSDDDNAWQSQDCRWDKLRIYNSLGASVKASTESKKLQIDISGNPGSAAPPDQPESSVVVDLPSDPLTALVFEPDLNTEESRSVFLAATFEDGSFIIYPVPPKGPCELDDKRIMLRLGEGPALALAWSPDGEYLAVGGTDLVQIWEREGFVTKTGLWREPLVTWRTDSNTSKTGNEQLEADEPLHEPTLNWSPDGEMLAFTLDREIAVITFDPPLRRS